VPAATALKGRFVQIPQSFAIAYRFANREARYSLLAKAVLRHHRPETADFRTR
jgi:hypothetical protein